MIFLKKSRPVWCISNFPKVILRMFLLKNWRKNDGFLLLEMAIVLIVMGLLGALLLPKIQHQSQSQKKMMVQRNFEIVFSALGAHARTHGSLPCPAPVGGDGHALKVCRGLYSWGEVPYHTLGLPLARACDQQGRALCYACVHGPPTSEIGIKKRDDQFFHTNFPHVLKIIDAKGVAMAAPCNPVIVVLLAVNESDRSPGPWERENLSKGGMVHDHPFSVHPKNPFRQQMAWRSKNDFYASYVAAPGDKITTDPQRIPMTGQTRISETTDDETESNSSKVFNTFDPGLY